MYLESYRGFLLIFYQLQFIIIFKLLLGATRLQALIIIVAIYFAELNLRDLVPLEHIFSLLDAGQSVFH